MTFQIVTDCETPLGCFKGILVSIYSLFVIFAIIRIMYRISIIARRRCSFEQIPLTFTIIQSLFLFMLNVFIMDTKLIITSLYLQTFTFGIISISCSQLCLRMKYPEKEETAKKYTFIAFLIGQIASLTVYILTLVDIIPIDCKNWFSVAYLFPIGVMLVYTLASITFGSSLINIIKTNSTEIEQDQNISYKNQDGIYNTPNENDSIIKISRTDTIMIDSESSQNRQLKRQLRLIEILFVMTILIQVTMDIIRTYALNDIIQCQGYSSDRSNEFQAHNEKGQIFLIFYYIIQITPCLITPYVFYYIPYKAKKTGRSILLYDQQYFRNPIPNIVKDSYDITNIEENLIQRTQSENINYKNQENNILTKQQSNELNSQKLQQRQNYDNKEKAQSFDQVLFCKIDEDDKNNKNDTHNNKSENFFAQMSKAEQDNMENDLHERFTKRQDTLSNMDTYIDRMNMKKDDVLKIVSQNSTLQESNQSLSKSNKQKSFKKNDDIESLENIGEEDSLSYNSQINKQQVKNNSDSKYQS